MRNSCWLIGSGLSFDFLIDSPSNRSATKSALSPSLDLSAIGSLRSQDRSPCTTTHPDLTDPSAAPPRLLPLSSSALQVALTGSLDALARGCSSCFVQVSAAVPVWSRSSLAVTLLSAIAPGSPPLLGALSDLCLHPPP